MIVVPRRSRICLLVRLINNSPARTRDLRGMDALSESETRRVKRWMPYGGGI